MTDQELGWLAGLLEGEGCFTTTGRNGKHGYIAIYLVSTDRDVVERAAEFFECRVQALKTRNALQRKQQFRCVIQGAKAYTWMQRVLPLMGERRAQRIRELLTKFETERPWQIPEGGQQTSTTTPATSSA